MGSTVRQRASDTSDLERLIRAYLRTHREIRELLELVRMTEDEYVRALLAYQVPVPEQPTIASTRASAAHVDVPATDRDAT